MLLPIEDMRDVKTPNRVHPTDAGLDFFCPKINEELIEYMKANEANSGIKYSNKEILIPPNTNAVIPSGIKIEIPYGFMGLFLNKSGMASKNDIMVGAQVIDTFYSGEVHIDLHNVGNKDFIVTSDMKLAQLVLTPIVMVEPTYSDELYYDMKLENFRDEAGFGSTDDKKA